MELLPCFTCFVSCELDWFIYQFDQFVKLCGKLFARLLHWLLVNTSKRCLSLAACFLAPFRGVCIGARRLVGGGGYGVEADREAEPGRVLLVTPQERLGTVDVQISDPFKFLQISYQHLSDSRCEYVYQTLDLRFRTAVGRPGSLVVALQCYY